MSFIYIFGFFAIAAYLFQGFLGFLQIKHFTNVYGELRRQGKVAIGRHTGKFKAGTIVMFSLDELGIIIEGRKMQGTTILAKFKNIEDVKGYHITELSLNVPCVVKENKLTRITMMDAVETYKKVRSGILIEERPAPFMMVKNQLSLMRYSIQMKLKGSVNK